MKMDREEIRAVQVAHLPMSKLYRDRLRDVGLTSVSELMDYSDVMCDLFPSLSTFRNTMQHLGSALSSYGWNVIEIAPGEVKIAKMLSKIELSRIKRRKEEERRRKVEELTRRIEAKKGAG